MAPVYEEAAKLLKEKHNHQLYEVNCQEESELCSTINIEGYPTMRLWYKGNFLEDFYERTTESIVTYIESMYKPSIIKPTTNEQVQGYLEAKSTAIFVHLSTGVDSAQSKLFEEFSDVNRSFGKFIQIPLENKGLVSTLNLPSPQAGVYCFRIFESPAGFLPELSIATETLKDFVIFERYPAIMEVGKEALDIAQIFKSPIIIVFYDSEELLSTIKKDFEEFAKSLRRKFVFSYSQGFQVAQNVGFQTEKYPLLAVYDIENNKPYLMDPMEPLTVGTIQHFLDNMVELDISVKMPQTEELPISVEDQDTKMEGKPFFVQPSTVVANLVTFFFSFSPLLL